MALGIDHTQPTLAGTSSDQQGSRKVNQAPRDDSLQVNNNNEAFTKLSKRPLPRGTRGRNDPRNAGMKRDRERYYQALYAAKQQDQPQQGLGAPSFTHRRHSTMPLGGGQHRLQVNTNTSSKTKAQISAISQVDKSTLSSINGQPSAMPRVNTNTSSRINGQSSAMSQRRRLPHQDTINDSPSDSPTSTARPTTSLMRPSPQAVSGRPPHMQFQGPIARRSDDWKNWIELAVKLYGLPLCVTTRDLWTCFNKEGSISMIDIFEDTKGNRDGKARIRFCPPPAKAFWQGAKYPISVRQGAETTYVQVELDSKPRTFLASSPVDPQVKYPEVMALDVESLDFGFMYDSTTMMGMYRVNSATKGDIRFRQRMQYREIDIQFQVVIRDSRPQILGGPHMRDPKIGKHDRTEMVLFRIPFAQVQVIHKVDTTDNKIILVISMETPPSFFRKINEEDTHDASAKSWTEKDTWFRQTDIVYNPSYLKRSSLTLKKTKPIIDIGRWTTYRFVLDLSKNDHQQYSQIRRALRDYNVEIVPFPDFKLITDREPAVWEYIDEPVSNQKSDNVLEELIAESVPLLSFPVRYQLEVCISQGCLNEHNLTRDFVNKLSAMEEVKAQDILEFIANEKKRIFDPMDIFKLKVIKGSASRPKIPHYCAWTRSATVTPSTVYYSTPTVETSNRVVRQYAEYADRFLRVRFSDEKFKGRIFPTDKDTMNEVFTRIKRAMVNGITIGDRHFVFLAFGNSQFREHGAYFFAPLPHLTVDTIRGWMGEFGDIKIVAKYAARIGQCFSTTRAINGTKVKIVQIPDVNRNGYCFTDGVGRISRFLAQLAASELGIATSREPPSLFQFRLGGCKGVLAVSPDAQIREIHIRHSQYKFPAIHDGLEIIRWSQFAAANLNRQIILVLSALGVSDDVFLRKLKLQLANLGIAMKDEKMALSILQKDIDPNQMTLAIAGMILDGFQKIQEPFVMSLLQLWRAWSIKSLKEKARITIGDGAFLLGCVDETGTLKGHFNVGPKLDQSTEEKIHSLPEVFVQLVRSDNKPTVIEGPMVLARNPSLHPGDLRVVRGVDVPALHHLKNVVVLPQTGDRDVASMCSGGDLDGDDYLIMWDEDLMPKQWNHEPMDYTPPTPVQVERAVTINDITSFFVTYMKNDALPTIALAHLATADSMEDGVMNEKCLKLAALHSMAVDYVKTGEPACMPRDLRPRKWPHFMEKQHKPKDQQYVSEKVLGKLYDQVERVDFMPVFDVPFDRRILNAYNLDQKILGDAMEVKMEYDALMRRIMAQHEIGTEFEVWSTLVMHHSNETKDYKFHEVIGHISTSLKDRFVAICYDKAGGKDFESIGPFVAAMYRITCDEMTQAIRECYTVRLVDGVEKRARKIVASNMPLMSFPWLFRGILGKIANKESQLDKEPVGAVQGDVKKYSRKPRTFRRPKQEEDMVQTTEGVTHRGELLELFYDSEQNENAGDGHLESPLQDGISTIKDSFPMLRKGSLIDIESDDSNTPTTDPPATESAGSSFSLSVDEMFAHDPTIEHVNQGSYVVSEGFSSGSPVETPAETEAVASMAEDEDGEFLKRNQKNEEMAEVSERNSEGSQKGAEDLGDAQDDEAEEEIVQLDLKPSLLEQLAKFNED